ncbi:MAG: MBL fold metallo-hydrolase [Candidatus Bathyarchaeia archaeon]
MNVQFLGATRQVTGSSYVLDTGGEKILIDCGLYQEREYTYRNWQDFPISPSQIQHLLLTHVHLDHSGLIPKLVRDGFSGDILLTPPSRQMLPIVLSDSARNLEEDAAFKKRRHESEGKRGPHPEVPLYTVGDAEKCYCLLKEVPYGEFTQLNSHVKVCFHDAGHILGSAMIEIILEDEGGPRSIIFSGDIGQWNKPLLNDPSVFDHADYLVMESTYGDRNHEEPQTVDEKLCTAVNETVKAGGNIVIPTFAIERAQELLYHFSRLARAGKIPYLMTFLDSPMAIEITKVFERCLKYLDEEMLQLFRENQSPFDYPGLKLVESVEGSKAINLVRGSSIIMAGSGMIMGGRIKHHLTQNITRPESTLLIVGYQAAGTLGRQILDGASPVRILGQSYPVRMKITQIEGFSAHAGMSDLQRWLNNFKSPPRHVFLTHGEDESIQSLRKFINSKNWEVNAPTYKEGYML